MTRRLFVACLVAWAGAGMPRACRAAEPTVTTDDPRRAVVIYGDRDNGFEIATILLEAGLACKVVAYANVTPEWTTDVDLVVAAACCPGGWRRDTSWSKTLLDRIGSARVMACGDTGASLLETKKLLIGHPNGAHWQNRPVSATFTADELREPALELLQSPHMLVSEPRSAYAIDVQRDVTETSHIGIYDGGAFPNGAVGIARLDGRLHHWLICQQGNYTLWGAGTRTADMTVAAKKLLANLAWRLAYAEPAPLVFPEKVIINESRTATLIGGANDECVYPIERVGELTIRLAWDVDAPMTLMTHGPLVHRVDGKSPLEITLPVHDALLGRELTIEVASFQLAEGEKVPFELTVDWED